MPNDTRIVEVRDFLFAPSTRVWIYGVMIAVIALLEGYGVIIDSQAGLWTGLASALIGGAGLGVLAIPNVPKPTAYDAFQNGSNG